MCYVYQLTMKFLAFLWAGLQFMEGNRKKEFLDEGLPFLTTVVRNFVAHKMTFFEQTATHNCDDNSNESQAAKNSAENSSQPAR